MAMNTEASPAHRGTPPRLSGRIDRAANLIATRTSQLLMVKTFDGYILHGDEDRGVAPVCRTRRVDARPSDAEADVRRDCMSRLGALRRVTPGCEPAPRRHPHLGAQAAPRHVPWHAIALVERHRPYEVDFVGLEQRRGAEQRERHGRPGAPLDDRRDVREMHPPHLAAIDGDEDVALGNRPVHRRRALRHDLAHHDAFLPLLPVPLPQHHPHSCLARVQRAVRRTARLHRCFRPPRLLLGNR
mmetsp:Transcript_55215/g.131139  ORF Transcript_55215/g.131139 Transcript_55215/m.131139 type:complete len:243 (+) Transcript_55215:49-777(+)